MQTQIDTKNERLANMNAARAARLAGKSPRQVGRERALAALTWIYRWGWSTPTAISVLVNDNQTGLSTRLVKTGLVSRTRTESGGGHKDVPSYILTLSKLGIEEVERHLETEDDLLPTSCDPYKVNQALLRHDHIAQLSTARALLSKTIAGYLTPHQIAQKSESGIKQPDATWLLGNGSKIGLEVELSAKWERDLDVFVRSCILAMRTTDTQPAALQAIAVVTDSQAIKKRYRAAFAKGATYGIWERDQNRHWKQVRTANVPEWVSQKVFFKGIQE